MQFWNFLQKKRNELMIMKNKEKDEKRGAESIMIMYFKVFFAIEVT